MGLEKNRFKVSAKPFNIGMIIVDLFLYPVRTSAPPSPFPSLHWGEGGVRRGEGVYPFSETTNPVITRLMSARGIKTFHPNFMI